MNPRATGATPREAAMAAFEQRAHKHRKMRRAFRGILPRPVSRRFIAPGVAFARARKEATR